WMCQVPGVSPLVFQDQVLEAPQSCPSVQLLDGSPNEKWYSTAEQPAAAPVKRTEPGRSARAGGGAPDVSTTPVQGWAWMLRVKRCRASRATPLVAPIEKLWAPMVW